MMIEDAIRDWLRKLFVEQQEVNRYEAQLAKAIDPSQIIWLQQKIREHRNEGAIYMGLILKQLYRIARQPLTG
ncbi:MAG TPA: hypothetical protein VGM02_01575 [Acidobacteriaceae bacterium]|jgi:uncharacterized membrane protein